MRGSLAILALAALLIPGCLEGSDDPDQRLDDGELRIVRGGWVVEGDLLIEDGARLVLSNASVEVHGSIRINKGSIEAYDSRINMKPATAKGSISIFAGNMTSERSDLLWIDAIEVQGRSSFSITGGRLLFGRMLIADSNLILEDVTAEASGTTQRPLPGTAVYELGGESTGNITRSIASGPYNVDAGSQLFLMSTGGDWFNLQGPGYKEVAFALDVTVLRVDGPPVANATVTVQSGSTLELESSGVTDEDGFVSLKHIYLAGTTTLMPHDPHVIRVDGVAVGTSTAAWGDQQVTVRVP